MTAGNGEAPVLVTGANGFVGRHVCEALAERNRPYRRLVRHGAGVSEKGAPVFRASGLLDEEGLRPALRGCHGVIHLAARVHVMEESAANPLEEFRRVNVDGSRVLARRAAQAGVRRFVFVSSIKVNGESTPSGAFRESDPPEPEDPYGQSKWEAEQALREIAAETGLELVVLRPPLLYGAGVKANFLRLMRLVRRGVPLPLGLVRNRRSLLFVRNLADAALAALDHPRAPGETFLVSDGPPLATPELVRAMAAALHQRPRLLPVPPGLLRWGATLAGRQAAVDRLLGSLEVDDAKIRATLGWEPPFSMEDGLRETAEGLRAADRPQGGRSP